MSASASASASTLTAQGRAPSSLLSGPESTAVSAASGSGPASTSTSASISTAASALDLPAAATAASSSGTGGDVSASASAASSTSAPRTHAHAHAHNLHHHVPPPRSPSPPPTSSSRPDPASFSPELAPAETYQMDSEAYDSSDNESLASDEWDALVEEADAALTEEQVAVLVAQLKEVGLVNFLRGYLAPRPDGSIPSLRKLLLGMGFVPPRYLRQPGTPDIHLLGFAKVALSRVLRRREQLPDCSSVDDAVRLLANAKRIIVLSGAGISTSCGIPDFRSATGLYAQLHAEGKYELDDPQQMFDIGYFREHPEVFYSFAKQIYPSNFVPSPCHRWIKLLEDRGVLLRNYTQNIDTLESLAGVTNVLQCHGSFSTASCLRCKDRMPGSALEPYIMSQTIPYCPKCRAERDTEVAAIKAYRASRKAKKAKAKKGADKWDDDETDSDDDMSVPEWQGEPGIIKPDITFFGQALDSAFDESLYRDREQVDLLVIMGTSLKVAPVSEVLFHIPHSVPQIYINLTPVSHVRPDICLLGDADSIVSTLSERLGWTIPAPVNGTPAPLPVAPDDAEWVSGQGDWSNRHFLRSRRALVRAAAAAEGGVSLGGTGVAGVGAVDAGLLVPPVYVRSAVSRASSGEGGEGEESDAEDGGCDADIEADGDGDGNANGGRHSDADSGADCGRPAKRSRMGSPEVDEAEVGGNVVDGDARLSPLE